MLLHVDVNYRNAATHAKRAEVWKCRQNNGEELGKCFENVNAPFASKIRRDIAENELTEVDNSSLQATFMNW